ncbi:MAG TPA: response regulator [Candidatus Binatia bacterium]|nr:response regulator [Candidatus Binatia bacterium]
MRILIVDDDKTFCQFLVEVLEAHGHDVDWTSHALRAFKLSQRSYYDLFVFDVRMPVILGTELAEGLKEQCPGAKIILISAFADKSLNKAANKLGTPLLSKPFTTEELLDLVAKTTAA